MKNENFFVDRNYKYQGIINLRKEKLEKLNLFLQNNEI